MSFCLGVVDFGVCPVIDTGTWLRSRVNTNAGWDKEKWCYTIRIRYYYTLPLHIPHCRSRRQAACPLPATRRSSHNAAGYLLQRGCSHWGDASTQVNKKTKPSSSHEEHDVLRDLAWHSIPAVLMGQRWSFFVSPSGRWKAVNECSSKDEKKKFTHLVWEIFVVAQWENNFWNPVFRWHHNLDHIRFYLFL